MSALHTPCFNAAEIKVYVAEGEAGVTSLVISWRARLNRPRSHPPPQTARALNPSHLLVAMKFYIGDLPVMSVPLAISRVESAGRDGKGVELTSTLASSAPASRMT